MAEYFGIYRGSIQNINDPENRGRVQCLVPAVLGDSPSGWAEPVLAIESASNWDVGDRVWVVFEAGDLNRPVYMSRPPMHIGDFDPSELDNIVTADRMIANNAFFKALRATDLSALTFTGVTIQTDERPDHGIHLDSDGFRAYGPDGSAPFFDVNPERGLVIVAGQGTFEQLSVTGDADLAGVTSVKSGGVLRLASGAIAPRAPTVNYTYDSFRFANDGQWGSRQSFTAAGGGVYYTLNAKTRRVERWELFGSTYSKTGESSTLVSPALQSPSLAVGDGYVWVGYYDSILNYKIKRLDPLLNSVSGDYTWGTSRGWSSTGKDPAIGYVPGSGVPLIIGQWQGDRLHIFRLSVVNSTTLGSAVSETICTDAGTTYHLSSIIYDTEGSTSADPAFDFPWVSPGNHHRYVTNGQDSLSARVFSGSGVYSASETWNLKVNNIIGMAWDDNAFCVCDNTGTVRRYTSMDATVADGSGALTKWVQTAYYNATGPYETPASPATKVVVPKRAKITVVGPVLASTPGAQDPNQVKFWIGSGSSQPTSLSMFLQTTPPVGQRTATYTSLTTSGSDHPKTTNSFLNTVASSFQASTGGFQVDSNSNGTVGTGTFAQSIDLRTLSLFARQTGARTKSNNQSVPNTTQTKVLFGTNLITPTGSLSYNTGTDTWTVGKAGVYLIILNLCWVAQSGGRRTGIIRVNGNPVATNDIHSNAGLSITNLVVWTGPLAAGATIDFAAYQSSGTAVGIAGDDTSRTFCSVNWLGI